MVCTTDLIPLAFIIYGLILKHINNTHQKGPLKRSSLLEWLYFSYYLAAIVISILFTILYIYRVPTLVSEVNINPVIRGWATDYFYSCIVISFFLFTATHWNNTFVSYFKLLISFVFPMILLPPCFYFYDKKRQSTATDVRKYLMMCVCCLLYAYQMYLWLPDIIAWEKTHCELDGSFPFATQNTGSKLIVASVTLMYLTLITYVWTEYNGMVSYVCGIIISVIGFYNLTSGLVPVTLYLIYNYM